MEQMEQMEHQQFGFSVLNDSASAKVEVDVTKPRRTRPVLSKYERCQVLAMRAEQIGGGTIPLVEALDGDGPAQIAEQEFAAGRIPFIIRRYLPDGSHEDWQLEELAPCDRRLSHK